jgi:hypothetical protein
MKKYKYVVVSGCSFSVGGELNLVNHGETYGDLIADHYGAEFYNLAENGGSFQSINRHLFKWCSRNKDKFDDMLVIIGFSDPPRDDFWHNAQYEWSGEGWYVDSWQRYMSGDHPSNSFIHSWSKKSRRDYFINFYNDNARFYYAINIIIQLQSFLKLNSIDHMFFDAVEPPIDKYWEKYCDDKEDRLGHKLLFDNLVSKENWYKHPKWDSFEDLTGNNIKAAISLKDPHPNKKGHRYWSEHLIEFIDEKINI